MISYLTTEDILNIHNVLVVVFEEDGDPISPSGSRNVGLVESAANRPLTSLGSAEKYKNVYAKASALFHSLVQNHAFHNGNKRTALVAMVRFLDMNHKSLSATDQELFDFVTGVARSGMPGSDHRLESDELVDRIEEWIAQRCSTIKRATSEVDVVDFLEMIKQAGGRVKSSHDNRSWIISGPYLPVKSVRIAKSTQRLAGIVARVYARKIGFTDGKSGISFDDLCAGIHPEQRIVGELIEVLRMLAHA
jgi:death-on-curing family protein